MSQPSDKPGALDLRLFGPFDALVDGEPLAPLRSRKGKWLLAILALNRNTPLDRDWLSGQLWPDATESHALYSLRRSLADLRAALGLQAWRLQSPTGRTLGLCLSDCSVDAVDFENAIHNGGSANLVRAITVYRGPLLQECAEEWCIAPRERFALQYVGALEAIAGYELAEGRATMAARYLALAAGAEPYSERLHTLWMQALAEAGDYACATQVWRDLRNLLRRDLNSEPCSEMTEAYRTIRQAAHEVSAARMAAPMHGTQMARASSGARADDKGGLVRSIPTPITRFVGRVSDLQRLRAQVDRDRLVTLTGAGGIGKTRLALHLAQQMRDERSAAVAFVDLGPLTDAAHLQAAAAAAVGVRETAGTALQDILHAHLSERAMVLFLDNCEHMLPACAEFTERLLTTCPALRMVMTSRQPLGLAGEAVVSVEPLPVPIDRMIRMPGDQDSMILESEAVQLFMDRAASACPDWMLTPNALQAAARICERVDGLPLAIEIAAAQTRLLTIEQIASALEDRLELLSMARAGGVARHRTIRATLDWSFQILGPAEQALFCRLSLFAGGWTLPAAEAVGGCERGQTLSLLASLVDRSLVVRRIAGDGSARYRFLAPVCEYAREQLATTCYKEETSRLRGAYYLQLAEGAAAAIIGSGQKAALQMLTMEHDNMRAVLESFLEAEDGAEPALRMAGALWRFWQIQSHFTEARSYLDAAICKSGSRDRSAARAISLSASAYLATTLSDYTTSEAHFRESLEIFQDLGDSNFANVLAGQGNLAHHQGEIAKARALFDSAIEIAERVGDTFVLARALAFSGDIACDVSDYDLARDHYQRSLAIQRDRGDLAGISRALTGIGRIDYERGGLTSATHYLGEALGIYRELGDRYHEAYMLGTLGGVAFFQGDSEAANEAFTESLRLREELGDRLGVMVMRLYLGRVATDLCDPDRAVDMLRAMLPELLNAPDLRYRSEWLRAAAELEMTAGRAARTEEERRKAALNAALLIGRAEEQPGAASGDLSPVERRRFDALTAAAQSVLGAGEFDAATMRGRAFTFEEAMDLAMSCMTIACSNGACYNGTARM